MGRAPKPCNPCRIAGQLGPIPSLEFLPFGWVVAEPAAQIVAGRCLPAPGVQRQRLFFHPARPEAFHEEARTIVFGGRLIHAFNLDHCPGPFICDSATDTENCFDRSFGFRPGGGGSGHWPVGGSHAGFGYEATSVRIFDQMQNTLEDVVLSLGAADVDNGRILYPSVKEANDALARVVVQSVEDFVNYDPAGFVQHDTRENQGLLLVIVEFPVPARIRSSDEERRSRLAR